MFLNAFVVRLVNCLSTKTAIDRHFWQQKYFKICFPRYILSVCAVKARVPKNLLVNFQVIVTFSSTLSVNSPSTPPLLKILFLFSFSFRLFYAKQNKAYVYGMKVEKTLDNK